MNVEINKIRIEVVVHVINTEHPTAMNFFIWFEGWCVRCGEIETMIIRQAILIYFTVLLREHSLDDVKLGW